VAATAAERGGAAAAEAAAAGAASALASAAQLELLRSLRASVAADDVCVRANLLTMRRVLRHAPGPADGVSAPANEASACDDGSRVVLEGFASPAECARLLARVPPLPHADCDPASALSGAPALRRGTLSPGLVRLVERARRAVAAEYGLPLAGLWPKRARLSQLGEETDEEGTRVRAARRSETQMYIHIYGSRSRCRC